MTVDAAIQNDKDADTARSEPAPGAAAPVEVVVSPAVPSHAVQDADHRKARVALEDPLVREYLRVKHEFEDYQQMALRNFSPWFINHSSNFVAATQVGSEMLMMRASGTKTLKDAKRVLLHDTKFSGGFDSIKSFFDLDHATKLEKKMHGDRLINRWQARSVLSGLSTMTLMSLLPDTKDTQEEIDEAVKLQQQSKLRYAASCLGKAVNPFQWYDNKRYLAGLGLTLAGVCSLFAGFRNVGRLVKGGEEIYVSNWAHSVGGAITMAAGSQLLFATDNRQGWARWGSTMWARMIFLPKSIMNRYQRNDPHANWYSAGQFGLQSSNVLSFLIGGAEKRSDGIVVDQNAMVREAKEKALIAKAEQPPSKHGFWREEVAETPQPRIQKGERSAVEHSPPVQAVANQKLYSQLHK
ncbi:MAG: hypothetical protein ACK52W_05005 [Alphaproteobacteria bacterium]